MPKLPGHGIRERERRAGKRTLSFQEGTVGVAWISVVSEIFVHAWMVSIVLADWAF